MFQKLKNMWRAFINGLKMAKEAFKGEKIDTKSQDYTDISQFNPLAIASNTISNLSCAEATFEVTSESAQADRLKELCKDIEQHRFEISESMLGLGEYYVLPYFDKGVLRHSYLPGGESGRARIIGDNEIEFVLDYWQNKNATKTLFLMRNHKLENDTLTITYHIVDEQGKETTTNYEPWNNIIENSPIEYKGDNINIGYGRYICPTSSRGLSYYGVPMNFGCGALEKELFEALEQVKKERSLTKPRLIADEKAVNFDDNNKKLEINGDIIPVRALAGVQNPFIIFNPASNYTQRAAEITDILSRIEYAMGLDAGILTENQAMQTATATAVKRSNSNTIAYIDAVHNALDNGNKMTLEADAMYLNVLPDLWEYNSDYIDPFTDMAEQFGYLTQALNAGAVETADITKWIYPQMSDEEIQEKLQRINDNKTSNTTNAIYASLTQ